MAEESTTIKDITYKYNYKQTFKTSFIETQDDSSMALFHIIKASRYYRWSLVRFD